MERIDPPDDVRIPRKHTQNRDLAESGGRDSFVIFVETSLFESDDLPSGLLFCSVNLAVSSFSYDAEERTCSHVSTTSSPFQIATPRHALDVQSRVHLKYNTWIAVSPSPEAPHRTGCESDGERPSVGCA